MTKKCPGLNMMFSPARFSHSPRKQRRRFRGKADLIRVRAEAKAQSIETAILSELRGRRHASSGLST